MKFKYVTLLLVLSLFNSSYAWENKFTHPAITEQAVKSNAAIDCFSDMAKQSYSIILTRLQPKFSQMVSDMGQMVLISRDEYTAKYDLLRDEDGETYGYPVSFVRDQMGNWKISKF